MREIKLRARAATDGPQHKKGDWLYGFYSQMAGPAKTIHFILSGEADTSRPDFLKRNRIDPETLGQFIARLDKNGKDIYEGDILRCSAFWGGPPSKTPKSGEKIDVVGQVIYKAPGFDIQEPRWCRKLRVSSGNSQDWYRGHCDLTWKEDIEIIGNIHETPKLLGQENA